MSNGSERVQEDPNDFNQAEPDHQDFKVLDRLALSIATEAAREDFDPRVALAGLVDPKSAITLGIGKAINFLGIESPKEMQERMDEVMAQAMYWVDGLHHGIEFERGRDT